jgi:glycerol uptake facilitator-like aquaporin
MKGIRYLKIKPVLAEFVGSAILAISIVGSGIMGARLSSDGGLALLINALAVAIQLIGKISGAHLNPVVTLVMILKNNISKSLALLYVLAQIAGAIGGVIASNYIFGLKVIQSSTQNREGTNLFVSEIIATAILLWISLANLNNFEKLSTYVPLWIFGGIMITSSTSFANPAVTIGRSFTDSATGIAAGSIWLFVIAQVIGALLGMSAMKFFKNE